jgi:hypothetical protein
VKKFRQSSTTEPADAQLYGACHSEEDDINAKQEDFHVFDLSVGISANVVIANPTDPSFICLVHAKLCRTFRTHTREEHD